jgi:hypothetical protein
VTCRTPETRCPDEPHHLPSHQVAEIDKRGSCIAAQASSHIHGSGEVPIGYVSLARLLVNWARESGSNTLDTLQVEMVDARRTADQKCSQVDRDDNGHGSTIFPLHYDWSCTESARPQRGDSFSGTGDRLNDPVQRLFVCGVAGPVHLGCGQG